MKRLHTAIGFALATVGVATLVTGSALAGGSHAAGAQTFTVDVDGKNPKVNEAFLAYYPTPSASTRATPSSSTRWGTASRTR